LISGLFLPAVLASDGRCLAGQIIGRISTMDLSCVCSSRRRAFRLSGQTCGIDEPSSWSCNMKSVKRSFQQFAEALQPAGDEICFEGIARRITERLGFRWFAYLRLSDDMPTIMSSYPKSWTDRYVELGYQRIDPVVRRARHESQLFSWGG